MSMFGEQEAERILLERAADAAVYERRRLDEAIFDHDMEPFISAVFGLLKDSADGFNTRMNLSGDDAMTFGRSGTTQIEIGKRTNPFVRRKVMFRKEKREVIVRTEQLIHYRQQPAKEEWWRFTVEHGKLLLDGKTPPECADALFSGLADAFR